MPTRDNASDSTLVLSDATSERMCNEACEYTAEKCEMTKKNRASI